MSEMKYRTLACYEVVEATPEGSAPFTTPLDWPTAVAALNQMELKDRTISDERDLIAEAVREEGIPTDLLMHSARTGEDWLSRASTTSGRIEPLVAEDDEFFVDTTVVAMLPGTNIVGLLRGGNAAPTARGMAKLLTQLQLFGEIIMDLRPIVAKSEAARLDDAEAMQSLDVNLPRGRALTGGSGGLYSVIHSLKDTYGDEASVTLKVTLPRRKAKPKPGDDDRRQAFLDDLRGLMPALTDEDRARAGLLFDDGENYSTQQLTTLVQHDLTYKLPMLNTSLATPKPMRVREAAAAVRHKLIEHGDELLHHVGDDS